MSSEQPKASNGLAEASEMFTRMGLPIPPIPNSFKSQLSACGDFCFSTRPIDPVLMYMFDKYLSEALTGNAGDYLAFSHSGHGANSYALNYHIVHGPLVLMVQAGFGGIYMDKSITTRLVTSLFDRCHALMIAMDQVVKTGAVSPSGRLYVFESDIRETYSWGWLGKPLHGEDEARAWLDQNRTRLDSSSDEQMPTSMARRWLEALPSPQPGAEPEHDADIVFHVGVAGGSLTIRRERDRGGKERFIVHRNEGALFDLLDEEDREGLVFSEDYEPLDTFRLALESIVHYRWYHMTPIAVLPEFAGIVTAEVSRLGESDDVQRWQRFLAETSKHRDDVSDGRDFRAKAGYPDRKTHELSDIEKAEIRHRIELGEETHAIAEALGCASTQVAAIRAAMSK